MSRNVVVIQIWFGGYDRRFVDDRRSPDLTIQSQANREVARLLDAVLNEQSRFYSGKRRLTGKLLNSLEKPILVNVLKGELIQGS
jgi:hypothetical protein